VAKDREGRFNSAHTLTRALEDVTLRVEGAEDLHPYPGLASFTDADAEYFFGRETEVEQMWRKLEGPPRLLGIMGPSGAGKTSFIAAGLVPNAPSDWVIVRCTPGNAATASLRSALTPELTHRAELLQALMAEPDNENVIVDALKGWREGHAGALLIVDQFEELFTLNSRQDQQRFSALLGRLPLENNIHVIASMRDDFAAACNTHQALQPIFSELTVLNSPTGENLRRALVQPATKCGYRFEDDRLVAEMLTEVEGERGALPLLAFAMSRLWEKRDRETGLLTRQAHRDIGGVGGALARHAEATVDRIGSENLPIVRELFRNLVTAEGTRAVREWNELLSIFSDSRSESEPAVLRSLVDARLLTSYEVREEDREPTRRVEIIHESLLANWPRLVRWQTQDIDAAQLRDQLRQAAKTWEEHDRSDDMLWTGSAYREFASWRERYPGGLTGTEEAFAAAMTSLASRRKRSRRVAVTAGFAILLAVLAVVGSLWQRGVRETLRAEAQKLTAIGQVRLDDYPTAALSYATQSLELADSEEARLLALQALWKGPPAYIVDETESWEIAFSPGGRWLVQTTDADPHLVHVIGVDGSNETLDDILDARVGLTMDSESGLFATTPWGNKEPWALWSAPEKRLISKGRSGIPENLFKAYFDLSRRRALLVFLEDDRFYVDALSFDGSSERLGELNLDPRTTSFCGQAPGGKWFAFSNSGGVFAIEFRDHELSQARKVGKSASPITRIRCDPLDRFVATLSEDNRVRLWPLDESAQYAEVQSPPDATSFRISSDGSFLEIYNWNPCETWVWAIHSAEPVLLRHLNLGTAGGTGGWILNPVKDQLISIVNPDPKVRLWSLRQPADAEPVIMQRGDADANFRLAVHPDGQWLATSGPGGLTFWPLSWPQPAVVRQYEERVLHLIFGRRGEWLATSSVDDHGRVRLWDLDKESIAPAKVLFEGQTYCYGLAASPDGNRILLGDHSDTVKLVPVDGGDPLLLPGAVNMAWGVAISRDGRLAAAAGKLEDESIGVIRVWNVESLEQVAEMKLSNGGYIISLRFTPDGHLLSSGNPTGLLKWEPKTGESVSIIEGNASTFAMTSDGTLGAIVQPIVGGIPPAGTATLVDLTTGSATPLPSHGDRVTAVAMDAEGSMVVTGSEDGTIRVGPITGEEPHLLLGCTSKVFDLGVDPRGRWIASSSGTEVRLWPMPDLSKPPLHTLPREQLIAKLKTLTNLRVVRDEDSPTGWKLTHDPFPGWAEVPTW